jgi:hypothetical protein
VLGALKERWQKAKENCMLRGLTICTLHEIVMMIKTRTARLAGHAERKKAINVYAVLVGKSEAKRTRGGSGSRLQNNIKTNVRESQRTVLLFMKPKGSLPFSQNQSLNTIMNRTIQPTPSHRIS